MKHRLRLHPHHLQQQRIFRATGAGTTTRTVNAVGVVIVAALGASEAVVLLLWILLSRLVHGSFVGHSTSYRAALAACVLILINAIHSAAFFRIIDQIGAVASALMKGVQTCLVFCVSAVLFCAVDSAQCFSTLKAVSCVLVVGGVVVYGTVRAPAAKMPLTGAADETV